MAAYDRRLLLAFLDELERRNWPKFPSEGWHDSLRIADLRAPARSKPLVGGEHLRNDERYWKSGVRAPDYDGWDAVRVSLDISIRRFWERRYGA